MFNLSNISPFSVYVTWSTPSDIGSPPGPLNYTVTLTNITDGTVLQYTLPSTQITLSNLLPGVQYNVSVYAENSIASGPPVTEVFRTNNSGELADTQNDCLSSILKRTELFNNSLCIYSSTNYKASCHLHCTIKNVCNYHHGNQWGTSHISISCKFLYFCDLKGVISI